MSSTPVVRLFAAQEPNERQLKLLTDALTKKAGREILLEWVPDAGVQSGFRLEFGGRVFDWTAEGRLEQLMNSWRSLPSDTPEESLVPLMRDKLSQWKPQLMAEESGTVLRIGDGIAFVSDIPNAFYGEILLFSGGVRGMVQELRETEIGCILFGDSGEVSAGTRVSRTGKTAGIPVGDGFLGRVIDPLGTPLDEAGPITAAGYRSLENPAPGILERQSVNRPMETGILSIDALFPIGKGQRELLIGDRQTGKTSIVLDAILNQKGKNVICIYVAIGQKNGTVAKLAQTLRNADAMSYTIIIDASASEPEPMQYLAPYAGCTLAEDYMHRGRDVLIIYDDLSRHAAAYRSLSLLLERSPGREAYPGDIFYLHSRLLERAAQLSAELGGGSMTALPIVETQDGDVSSYIPTNIISITDGQIFLQSDLFREGQRPAVNVGLSVSRVGGAAQTKVMKQAVGALRIELAQYRELSAFSQFAGELDAVTAEQLAHGRCLMDLLKQENGAPYSRHYEVYLLLIGMNCFRELSALADPAEKAKEAAAELTSRFPDLTAAIDRDGRLPDGGTERLLAFARAYLGGES